LSQKPPRAGRLRAFLCVARVEGGITQATPVGTRAIKISTYLSRKKLEGKKLEGKKLEGKKLEVIRNLEVVILSSSLYNTLMTNAERQKKYYYAHKHEKALARKMLGVSTYTKYHKKYFNKKRGNKNGL